MPSKTETSVIGRNGRSLASKGWTSGKQARSGDAEEVLDPDLLNDQVTTREIIVNDEKVVGRTPGRIGQTHNFGLRYLANSPFHNSQSPAMANPSASRQRIR
jgi:hypothetical protein